MTSTAILDAGPLFAWFDHASKRRSEVIEVLGRGDLDVIVPALPLAEALYLVETRLGPAVGSELLEVIQLFPIVGPSIDDIRRMVDLTRQYSSFPLGAADASIIALAERVGASRVITFDHRHFRAVRPQHVAVFELLPG